MRPPVSPKVATDWHFTVSSNHGACYVTGLRLHLNLTGHLMLTADNFEIAQIQTSVFTPGLQIETAKVLAFLTTKWSSVFTGEPLILPPGPMTSVHGVTIDTPRIVLNSEDSAFRLHASSTRCDYIRARQTLQEEISLEDHLRRATAILVDYLEVTRGVAGRLACVVIRVARDDAPGLALARHFCRDRWLRGPLNRPSDFELHAHKSYTMRPGFTVNSWVRCKTGIVGEPGIESTQQNAIVVEQDLNTLAEETQTREFSPSDLSLFCSSVPHEMLQVLNLYFPKDDADAT